MVSFRPSLVLPILTNTETIINDEKDVNIKDVLTTPGTRLIMPDEESKIERGENIEYKKFDVFSSSGRREKPNPHSGFETFGKVYANDLAKSQVWRDLPIYPIGSIFVREKLLTEKSETPDVVTAMVKRERGFDDKTGDWEYFTFSGTDLQLQKRQTKSDCSKCHANASQTDYVFKQYLK